VLDQGSTDGTREWLYEQDDIIPTCLGENIGINQGMNYLLDNLDLGEFDVIVKFDNDCELLDYGTLLEVCLAAADEDMILSPRIHGLRNPVPTIGHHHDMDLTPIVGGIFMAVPAYVYRDGYRHRENVLPYGSDDSDLCAWWRAQGKHCGYVQGYDANHYLTTDGQHADIPDYFARTLAEGKPSIL
jgi:hypothetical protein